MNILSLTGLQETMPHPTEFGVQPQAEARDLELPLTGTIGTPATMGLLPAPIKTRGKCRMYRAIWACRLYEIQPTVKHDGEFPIKTNTRINIAGKEFKDPGYWTRLNIKQAKWWTDFPEGMEFYPEKFFKPVNGEPW